MGHGRQQARRARLSLASGGHNCLARLPRVCQLVAARQTRAHPHLGAQRAGRSHRSKDRTAEADARSREGGAHGAQITSGTASGIPAHVRPAGEPASRGGTLAFTACYSSMDGSRHQDGRPAGVAAGAAGSSRTGRTARMAGRTCESREPRGLMIAIIAGQQVLDSATDKRALKRRRTPREQGRRGGPPRAPVSPSHGQRRGPPAHRPPI